MHLHGCLKTSVPECVHAGMLARKSLRVRRCFESLDVRSSWTTDMEMESLMQKTLLYSLLGIHKQTSERILIGWWQATETRTYHT